MRLRLAQVPLAALLLLTAACRQPAGEPDPAAALLAWCELKATNECDYRAKCGLLNPAERSDCIADSHSQCANDLAVQALREGRSTFVEERAQSCPANFYMAECHEFPECPLPFEGTIGEAERCSHDVECRDTADGFRCVGSGCARTCQRSTEPRVGGVSVGQLCGGELCHNGWCDQVWENGEQVRASCEPYLPLGSTCSGIGCDPRISYCEYRPIGGGVCVPLPNEGEECGPVGECARGLICDQTVAPRVCGQPHERGEPCGWDGECRLGLVCRSHGEGEQKLCSFRARLGEYCNDFVCESGTSCDRDTNRCEKTNPKLGDRCTAQHDFCQGTSWCQISPDGVTGTCVTAVPAGSRCGSYLEGSLPRCERGFDCSPLSSTCEPPAGEGAPCDSFCGVGLFCHFQKKTCMRVPKLGEPCDMVCEGLLACVEGTCAPRPALCEPCAQTRACAIGAICDPVSLRCASRREPGEPCGWDLDCRLGICDEGLCVAACR